MPGFNSQFKRLRCSARLFCFLAGARAFSLGALFIPVPDDAVDVITPFNNAERVGDVVRRRLN